MRFLLLITPPHSHAAGDGVVCILYSPAVKSNPYWLRSRNHNFQLPVCNFNFRCNSFVTRSLCRFKQTLIVSFVRFHDCHSYFSYPCSIGGGRGQWLGGHQGECGVRAYNGDLGAEGAKPPKAESILVIGCPTETANLAPFHMLCYSPLVSEPRVHGAPQPRHWGGGGAPRLRRLCQ